MSVKPAGGALRLEVWRIAGILVVYLSPEICMMLRKVQSGSGSFVYLYGEVLREGACGGVEVQEFQP
jgi:hypothetical protein